MHDRQYVATHLLASLMQLHPAAPMAELVGKAVEAADALIAQLAPKSDQEPVVPGDDK